MLGAPLAESFIRLRADGSSLKRDIPDAVDKTRPAVDKASRRVGVGMSKSVGGGFRLGIGGAMKGGLAVLAGSLAGAVAGGALIKRGLIDPASELNETVSKTQVIFPKSSAAMLKWSKRSAQAFGISRQQALAATSQFGDMFQQLGFTEKAANQNSRELVRMAADLGSLNNVEPTDMLDRISAALRGEFDSLQAVIPNINAARVETVALAETGKKAAKDLTAQEKAQAVLAIITKDGARAQGDFARTADGAANKTRIQTARIDDLQAKIGTKLLPVYGKALDGVSALVDGMETGVTKGKGFDRFMGTVGVKIRDAGVWLEQDGVPAMQEFGDVVEQDVLPAIRPLVPLVGDLLKFVVGLPTPLLLTAGAIGLAGKAANIASPFIGGVGTGFRKAREEGNLLKGGLKGFTGIFGGPWGLAFSGAIGVLAAFWTSQHEAKAKAHELAETLDEQTGAVTKLSEAHVLEQLRQNGTIDLANKLGLSLRDVTLAALGDASAQQRIRRDLIALEEKNAEVLAESREKAKTSRAAAIGYGTALKDTQAPIDEFRKKLGNANDQLARAAREARDTREALGQLAAKPYRVSVQYNYGVLKSGKRVPLSLTPGGGGGGPRPPRLPTWTPPIAGGGEGGFGGADDRRIRIAIGSQRHGERGVASYANRVARANAFNGFRKPLSNYHISARWMSYPGHTGIDLAGPVGTPVGAAAAGRVSAVRALTTSYGKHVVVDHPGGWQTLYAHMSSLSARVGEMVGQGSKIGRRGSTGNSTGPHLHFETIQNGRKLNPESVMSFDQGGMLPPGLTLAHNGTGGPEPVGGPLELSDRSIRAIGQEMGLVVLTGLRGMDGVIGRRADIIGRT